MFDVCLTNNIGGEGNKESEFAGSFSEGIHLLTNLVVLWYSRINLVYNWLDDYKYIIK